MANPRILCVHFIKGGWRKGYTRQNVDKKGDTAFRRPQGFRCTCGRWHQFNGPAGCMCFHGTLFFIYSPSLYQNSQIPDGLWYKHSPPQKAKRTHIRIACLICAPRACVSSKKSLILFRAYWMEEEEYRLLEHCSDELMWEEQQQQQQQQLLQEQ